MSLVDKYTNIISELDDITPAYLDFDMKDLIDHLDQDIDDPNNKMTIFLNEFKRIHHPLADGKIDPGDIDNILDNIFSHYEDQIIARAKKMVSLQQQLRPLYEQLQHASEQEWQEYVRYIELIRLTKNAPLIIKTMRENLL